MVGASHHYKAAHGNFELLVAPREHECSWQSFCVIFASAAAPQAIHCVLHWDHAGIQAACAHDCILPSTGRAWCVRQQLISRCYNSLLHSAKHQQSRVKQQLMLGCCASSFLAAHGQQAPVSCRPVETKLKDLPFLVFNTSVTQH